MWRRGAVGSGLDGRGRTWWRVGSPGRWSRPWVEVDQFYRLWCSAGGWRMGMCAATLGIGVLTVSVCCSVLSRSAVYSKQNVHQWQTVAAHARDLPLSVPMTARPSLKLSSSDGEWLTQLMRPEAMATLNQSGMLHLMRLYGTEYTVRVPGTTSMRSLLDILTDDQLGALAFATPPMVLTDTGVRFTDHDPAGRPATYWRGAEVHRDQFLASMADLGVPLSRRIILESRTFSLRDVLRDSLAQVHVAQTQLEWTASAYALYLPPESSWINRYGEASSFDDMAAELLGRSPEAGSCCGMHIVLSLTAILQADSLHCILTASTRQRIQDRLAAWLRATIRTQREDGSWPADWWNQERVSAEHSALSPAASEFWRLVATSHITEWLYALPAEFTVPEHVLTRAARYLLVRLRAAAASDMMTRENLCPYSHACYVLRHIVLSQTSSQVTMRSRH